MAIPLPFCVLIVTEGLKPFLCPSRFYRWKQPSHSFLYESKVVFSAFSRMRTSSPSPKTDYLTAESSHASHNNAQKERWKRAGAKPQARQISGRLTPETSCAWRKDSPLLMGPGINYCNFYVPR